MPRMSQSMNGTYDKRKTDQRHGQRNHRGSYRECDRAMALQTIFRYNGIGNQGVGRQYTAEQQCGKFVVMEPVDASVIDHDKRNEEGEQSEDYHLPQMLARAFNIHFESREEHDEIESYLSENLK